MGDRAASTGLGDNTEHKIRRAPDLQVVAPGAKMRYSCEWIAPGGEPTVAGDDYWGPRDGIRWYSYSDQLPKGFFQKQIKPGPLTPCWDRTWDEEPGHYTVIAEIRSRLSAPGTAPTYCFRSQQIGDTGALLKDWLDNLLKKGKGPSPDDAEREIRRYRTLLDDVAKKLPPSDPETARKHKETVDKWGELAGRLRSLLSTTDDKKRIPIRAIHLETATQAQRPLLLFLADMGEVHRMAGKAGMVTRKRWLLVDWTDPGDPRFRGDFDGEGNNAKEAIESALSGWDWGNRYPEGHVTFEIPAELRGMVGGAARRQLDTSGKNFTDELIVVFEWIAIGSMLVAGFCFIFLSIPALVSGAMATSLLASTAGAVFSIGQRWRDGIFDWKADAIDGLTVVGNLVGAGVWARGARVRILDQAGKKLDFVFLGARIGTDAAQGILIIDSRIGDLDKLMKDPSYPPEERARKMLALFAELTVAGLMTALSFHASAKEAENLSTKPRHLTNDPRANVPEDRLSDLTNAEKTIDTTTPPIAEGHAKEGKQKTTVNTGVKAAPKVVGPEETVLARSYPKDDTKWMYREVTKYKVQLIDHDNFGVMAEVDPKTGDMTMVIETTKGRKQDGSFQGSKYLRAKEVYPRLYQHFSDQGVLVKSVSGDLLWDNIRETSLPRYDQLMNEATTKNPNLAGEELEHAKRRAAEEAIKVAKTFKYHQAEGLTTIVVAKRVGNGFEFKIAR